MFLKGKMREQLYIILLIIALLLKNPFLALMLYSSTNQVMKATEIDFLRILQERFQNCYLNQSYSSRKLHRKRAQSSLLKMSSSVMVID